MSFSMSSTDEGFGGTDVIVDVPALLAEIPIEFWAADPAQGTGNSAPTPFDPFWTRVLPT